MAQSRFVKSGNTQVSVGRTQAELEKILRRYGASAFSISQDYDGGTATVQFRVPEAPDSDVFVPVRLVVEIPRVVELLKEGAGPRTRRSADVWYAQAERVGWRHLVLWVEAALVAVETGLQTVSEAFLAQMLIEHNGRAIRVYDQFAAAGGVAGLLAAK